MLRSGNPPFLFNGFVQDFTNFIGLTKSGIGSCDLSPIPVNFFPGHFTLILPLFFKHLIELKNRVFCMSSKIVHMSPSGKPLDTINMNRFTTEPGPCSHIPVTHNGADRWFIIRRPIRLVGVFPTVSVIPVFMHRFGFNGISHRPGGHHFLITQSGSEKEHTGPGTNCFGR